MTARVDPIPREARDYQGHRAGVITRLLATIIDVAVVTVFLLVVYAGIGVAVFLLSPTSFNWPVPPVWLALVAGYCSLTVYWAATWTTGGRSYGCHVMGLRVIGRRGHPPRPSVSLLRSAFCVAFPLGFAWVLFSEQNRSLQDIVLRTSVVYDWDVRPGRVAD